MALRYVIKKRTFGFDKTKAEKYVAQNVITNTVDFRDLCEEITKVGMVPSGAVKFVLDALIYTLKLVLSEVLRDLRKADKCYIKYELKQGCFHITTRGK